jgi:excisionase family DNA binding protein
MAIESLLELGEAADLLGVHSSTLRRWADSGKVASIRTLSGRRRFSLSALEQARKEMGHAAADRPTEQLETQALDIARQRTSSLSGGQANWFAHLDEEHRLLFRYSGQRLLGLMMQFISRGDSAEKFLTEGRKVAADYGRICYRAGLTIAQTAEAFLYFRRSILESVQVTAGLGGPNDPDGYRIFLRTVDFFDALLVATMESYANMNQ